MKHIKSLLVIMLILAIVLNLCACADINSDDERTHRLQWWLEAINWVVESRTNGLSGKNVRIAVLDSPIDDSHPDLVGKVVEQHYIGELAAEPRYEHGTAVAGIICASPHNEDGVLGVAVDAEMISVVIANGTEASVGALVKGIEYAIEKEVDIINISAGIINDDPELKAAVDKACEAGIVIVAAAGIYQLYPANYDNVISVNSVDSNGRELFSGNGDVYLPGGNIVTTYSSVFEPKEYVSYTGTSMSAPILTGVIALLMEQNSELTNGDIVGYFSNYRGEFNTLEILEDFEEMFARSIVEA